MAIGGLLSSIILYFMGSLVLLVTFLWLLATIYIYLVYKKYAHIPTPKMRSFYLGHLPAITTAHRKGLLLGDLMLEWGHECGPVFVVFFVHHPMVCILNANDIKQVVMNVKLPKAKMVYRNITVLFSQRFLGRGLVTLLDYDSWKPRRSLYDPSFTKGYLKSLVPAFNGCVDHFLDNLKFVADGKTEVILTKELEAVILQIIGKILFGCDFSQPFSDEDIGLKHVKGDGTFAFLIEHSFKGVGVASVNILHSILHPHLTEGYRETVRGIRQIGRKCILQRLKAIFNKEEVPNDILTQIVRVASSDKSVDIDDLVDDFATFYVAVQDTTSFLTFALVNLCQHPEVQQRVVDEITEVLGDRDFVTAEDIEHLQYMDQVFLEILRLYPPADATAREVSTDNFQLSSYALPKGTTIFVSYYANHRNPNNWEDPEIFNPSRFNPDRGKPDPFVFSPFSRGHRSCIAKVFVMMESKIILARLLNSFKITLQDGYKLKVEHAAVLRPADYVHCTIAPLK